MVLSEFFKSAPSASIPNLSGRIINNGRLRMLEPIGRGAWGVVYSAESVCSPHKLYAVKCINPTIMSDRQRTLITQEVALQNVCATSSDRVLKIHDVVEDPERGLMFIVTEFCAGGDMLTQISKGEIIGNTERIREIFLQILDAVDACHKLGVYHCDLKPENILCRDSDGDDIILGDFGFATTQKTSDAFGMGSKPFMSPEVRGGLRVHLSCYSPRLADIWALGIILMNLITGSQPWHKASLSDPFFMEYANNNPNFLYDFFPISRGANEILKSMLAIDPRKRTSLGELRTRVLEVKSFGPGRFTRPDPSVTERYIDDGFSTDPSTLASTNPSETESVTLHVVNCDIIRSSNSESSTLSVPVDIEDLQRELSESSISSSEIGPLAADDIFSVPVLLATNMLANIVDEVSDYDSDSDSDADSEGPITPETHAVDEAATADDLLEDVEDVTELDLSAAVDAMHLKVQAHASYGLATAQGKNADSETQPSARRMLMSTARELGLTTPRYAPPPPIL